MHYILPLLLLSISSSLKADDAQINADDSNFPQARSYSFRSASCNLNVVPVLPPVPPPPTPDLPSLPGADGLSLFFASSPKYNPTTSCLVLASTLSDLTTERFKIGVTVIRGNVPLQSFVKEARFLNASKEHEYIATLDNIHSAPKEGDRCIVTSIDSELKGRATLSYENSGLNGTAVWTERASDFSTVFDSDVAAEIMSHQFEKRMGRSAFDNTFSAYLSTAELQNKYQQYNEVINGPNSSIREGYYGFSIDFIEKPDEIENFIIEQLIVPASDIGLIDDKFKNDPDIVGLVISKIFSRLGYDNENKYGSDRQVKITALSSLSNIIPSNWNDKNLSPFLYVDINGLTDPQKEVFLNKVSTDEEAPTAIEVIKAISYGLSEPDYQDDFFKFNHNILLDKEKGLITYKDRKGGYLGKTYLDVAADAYGKKIAELTPDEILTAKNALESIGFDTLYPIGTLRSTKSFILNRFIATSFSSEMAPSLDDGGAAEMFDAILPRLSDSGKQAKFLAQQYHFDLFKFSGLSVSSAEELWDAINTLNAHLDSVEALQRSAGVDENNTEISTIAFSDEDFVKTHLYSLGVSSELVKNNWKRYAKSNCRFDFLDGYGNFCGPNVVPSIYSGNVNVPENVKQNQLKSWRKYRDTTGKMYFTIRDMWHTDFNKTAEILSVYAASNIITMAKLQGLIPWAEPDSYQNSSLHTTTEMKMTKGDISHNSVHQITPENWVVHGDKLGFSIQTQPNIEQLMTIDKIKFISHVGMSDTYNIPLFVAINKIEGSECDDKRTSGHIYYKTCRTKHYGANYYEASKENALRIHLENLMKSRIGDFKTIYTNSENFVLFLKEILPLWSTIEDIQNGDLENIGASIVGDAMFLIPIGYGAGKISTSYLKATNKKFPKKFKTSGQVGGLAGKDGKPAVIGSRPDAGKYAKEAAEKAKVVSNDVLDDLDGVGNLHDLSSKGHPRLPGKKPSNYHTPPKDNFVSSGNKYTGNKNDLKDNGDGTFKDKDGKEYIKEKDEYYLVQKDADGNLYLVDKDGNLSNPIKKDKDGNWESNTSLALTPADLKIFGADAYYGSLSGYRTNIEGLYQKERKPGDENEDNFDLVKVNKNYFKASWDPVYNTAYVYTPNWNNRMPIFKGRKGQWYKDAKTAQACTF